MKENIPFKHKWVRHVNNLHKVRIGQSRKSAYLVQEKQFGFSYRYVGTVDLLIDDVKPMNSGKEKTSMLFGGS